MQAGGNVGVFPRRLAEVFERVYTFEPDAALFAALCANAPAVNIVKLQAALGWDRGTVGLACRRRDGSLKPAHPGMTFVEGAGAVPVLRVDDLGLEVCDLLYLDIEGREFAALRGAEETIRRCRPVLALEINKQIEHAGLTAEELRGYIRTLGYRPDGVFNSDEVFVPWLP